MELIYDDQYLFQYPVLTAEMRKRNLTITNLIHITQSTPDQIRDVVINYGSISYETFKLIRDTCFPNTSLSYLMQRKAVKFEEYINQIKDIKSARDM